MLNPGDAQIALTLATVLEKLGHGEEAEKEWREALTIDPESSTALDALSRNLIVRHDYTGVIALLDKKSPAAHLTAEQTVDLGTSLAAVARLDDAIRTLQEGLATYPDSLPIAHQLAMVLMIMDRSIEASHIFELALQNHPHDQKTETMYLKALVLGRSERAPDQARRVLALYPHDWQALYLSAVLENRSARFSDARRHLERSIALNPIYAPSHAELGKVFQELGDLGRSKAELERAEALGDRELDVHYELARVLRSLGQEESATDKFNDIKQQKADGLKKSRSALLTVEADQAIADGKAQLAAERYREALANTPDDSVLHYKLAKAFDLLNNTSDERAELVLSIQLNPNPPEAQNQLGFLTVRTGDARKAEEYFRAALKASPSYFVAWINLAAALASEAKWTESEEAVNGALRIAQIMRRRKNCGKQSWPPRMRDRARPSRHRPLEKDPSPGFSRGGRGKRNRRAERSLCQS